MVSRRPSRQAFSGGIFVLIGVFAVIKARDYQIGSVTQMGPGYFPACLGILLVVLGLFGMFQGFAGRGERLPALRLGPPALVMASVVFFGLAVDRVGLIAGVCGVVVISTLLTLRHRPLEILAMAACLCVLTAAVFIHFLGLPFKLY